MQNWKFDTRLIHSGIDHNQHNQASSIPIYETASFAYNSAQDLADVFDNKKFGYIYSRISNPTVYAFEQKINSLEQGIGAIATSSGMAAITTIILALTQAGDEIISSKSLFGGTFHLFNQIFKKYNIKINYVDTTNLEAYKNAISTKTQLVFVETLGNPKLDIPEINSLSQITHNNNIPLIVDSTLTTPYLFQAKKFGVDIVVHSTTKYITGNGSTIGGIFIDLGNYNWKNSKVEAINMISKKIDPVFAFLAVARQHVFQNIGCCLSPFNAYLHNFGIETLSLRMERHCSNALHLAKYLDDHPKIKQVNYPGLKNNTYHKPADLQFNEKYGGILTFKLNSRIECFKFIDNIKMIKNLANLGDTKTLIIHPSSTIYHDCTQAEMLAAGVTDDLLRVSVGIEDIDDIIHDFNQALGSI